MDAFKEKQLGNHLKVINCLQVSSPSLSATVTWNKVYGEDERGGPGGFSYDSLVAA